MNTLQNNIFTATLDKNRLSHTKERLELFSVLIKLDAPCTITELIEKTSSKMNRSTVYRTINLFEKINITNRVYSGLKYKIELGDQFSPHHHHFTCTNCGNVSSFIESQSLLNELNSLQQSLNTKVTSHSIELLGYCRNCK